MNKALMKESSQLPAIPEASVNAYTQSLALLVEKVNKIMSSRTDIRMLIGDNPLQLMFENHKNHAVFMNNIFSLQQYTLLAQTVPWAYRTYHSRGFSYSYFPAHLRAWRAVLAETLPEDQAEPLIQVYEWMVSRHEDFIAWSRETSKPVQEPSEPWNEVYREFVEALVQGHKDMVMEVGQNAVHSAQDLPVFYLNVIQPAMYAVGEMWERGEMSVAKEHLASALVNRLMSAQYVDLFRLQVEKKGRAVVTAAANEFHEIGAIMVANSLELDGWEIEYLGSNMPQDDLLDFVFSYQPDILAVSVAMSFNLLSVRSVIQQIKSWPEEKHPKIMVGGLAFHGQKDLAEQLGADGYAQDCGQAVQVARKWQERAAQ